MYHFCRLNGWDLGSVRVISITDGVYHLRVRAEINDVDDVKIIPDDYHIGSDFDGQSWGISIYKEDRKLCVLHSA